MSTHKISTFRNLEKLRVFGSRNLLKSFKFFEILVFYYKILLFERYPQWFGNNEQIYFIFYGYSENAVKNGRSINSYVSEYSVFYVIPATKWVVLSNLIKIDIQNDIRFHRRPSILNLFHC